MTPDAYDMLERIIQALNAILVEDEAKEAARKADAEQRRKPKPPIMSLVKVTQKPAENQVRVAVHVKGRR